MDVDFAFLCDYADASGKLHAMGIGIDVIYAKDVPALHHGAFVVIQMRFNRAESGEREVEIRVMGPDGQDVAKADGTMQIGEAPEGMSSHVSRIVLGFRPLPLRWFGSYSIHCLINGDERARIPFSVVKPSEQNDSP